MKKIIYISIVVFVFWFIFLNEDQVSLGPGVFAPDAPIQEKITDPESFELKGYTITPLANFHIKAKVLSRKNYNFGKESDLSPVDLALGWGKMSDESVLATIDISQSNRWYKWWTESFQIPRSEIETNSANMHIIPANDLVDSELDRVRTGDIVEFKGKLVRVDDKDGWHWASSLTRNDTGSHACELIWVEEFGIQN